MQSVPADPGSRPVLQHQGLVRSQGLLVRAVAAAKPPKCCCPEPLLREGCAAARRLLRVRCCEKAVPAKAGCEKACWLLREAGCCEKACCSPTCCEKACQPKCHKLYRRPVLEMLEDMFGPCGDAAGEAGCEAGCGGRPFRRRQRPRPRSDRPRPRSRRTTTPPPPVVPKPDTSTSIDTRGIYQASRSLARN